ncbi:MAG TPA: hypothetical protein VK598_02595 [Nitrospiraceae bacterium]|nr:hypothetical protein [Nitrospiraceae bacterium]
MTSKDWFTLALRVVGVLKLIDAADYFVQAFDISTHLFRPSSTTLGACYSHIFVYLAIGLYLINGAPHLVAFIYDRKIARGDKADGGCKVSAR